MRSSPFLRNELKSGAFDAERRVLEHRREIPGLALTACARARHHVALLQVRALDGVALGGGGPVRALHVPRPLLGLVLFVLLRHGEGRQAPLRQRDGRRDGQQEPGGQRERDELRLARQEARDDPPPGEGVDARRGVGDERVHDGRAVRARPPLERGRDAILKLVPAIGQARHVARRQLQGESVDGSDEESRAQQRARRRRAPAGRAARAARAARGPATAPANSPRRP